MRRFWVSTLYLAVLFIAPAFAQRATNQPPQQLWRIDGVERSAVVMAPSAPVPAGGSPLVFVFHGHGGTAAHAARTFAIHSHWPEAIVIYAQGLPTPGRLTDPQGLKPGWQHAPGEQGDRDLKLVDAMITWARARFRVDAARVYAAGHSNGGTFTYVLWAARGGAFAAFAPSSSVFRKDLIASAKPKPALVIIGEKDELVRPAAQRLSLDALLRLNQAGRTGQRWSGAYASRHSSPLGADVVAYVHPGDHTLPTDAGEMMVKFFKER